MLKKWIIVAESSRARIFAMDNLKRPFQEIEDLVHPEGRQHVRDLTQDRPPRKLRGRGQAQHPIETNVDPKHQEAIYFSKRIAERVENARVKGEFEELVLIAAPEFLGLLRENLSATTKKRVIKSLDKNLVQFKEAEIRAYLMG